MVEITGFAAVRAAARDVENYSSNLQGDRDVRTYRQLPLEVDPPDHHKYRVALSPLFVKKTVDAHVPAFQEVARRLIADFVAQGGGDVVSGLALPMVVNCLGVLYNRPQDVAEWLSWGADVWATENGRSGVRLDTYLPRVFDEAEASNHDNAGGDDVWRFVSRIEIDGRRLTRTEMFGMASVLLAGGRDTVVKLMTGALWHLGTVPADREFLRANPDKIPLAISELLRYLSPLPRMERAPKDVAQLPDDQRDPTQYVQLSFVSGNHDPEVFDEPHRVNIHRGRVVSLAFGAGPHTCVGNHVAEVETRAFVEEFLRQVPSWTIEPQSVVDFESVGQSSFVNHFESLWVTPDSP
jgi:cytochrome P450